eukprot:4449943-Lingulodinium_polyedra.AAC.1
MGAAPGGDSAGWANGGPGRPDRGTAPNSDRLIGSATSAAGDSSSGGVAEATVRIQIPGWSS